MECDSSPTEMGSIPKSNKIEIEEKDLKTLDNCAKVSNNYLNNNGKHGNFLSNNLIFHQSNS